MVQDQFYCVVIFYVNIIALQNETTGGWAKRSVHFWIFYTIELDGKFP